MKVGFTEKPWSIPKAAGVGTCPFKRVSWSTTSISDQSTDNTWETGRKQVERGKRTQSAGR